MYLLPKFLYVSTNSNIYLKESICLYNFVVTELKIYLDQIIKHIGYTDSVFGTTI